MRKFFLTVLLFAAFPVAALAIPSGEMTFKATASDDANEALIEKGIEAAIDDMSFLVKPIAKGKLEKTNSVSKVIKVNLAGGKLAVKHDGRPTVKSAPDGKTFKWTREDGDVFNVTQTASDDTITQVYSSDEGKKTMHYKFSPDFKTLKLEITVESPKLPAPLRYSIAYAQ